MDSEAFTEFRYVVYIRSGADKVWDALTNGETTRKFWSNHRNTSDWKIGSQWKHEDFDDKSIVDVVGTVLESARPGRLVVTWSSPADVSITARVSRVMFEIEEDDGLVRVVLVHDQLPPDSTMLDGIADGWPHVLSSLKSLLETGNPLPEIWQREDGEWCRRKFL
jgi:uncharacterized protein YndB with AHSA1/START domain